VGGQEFECAEGSPKSYESPLYTLERIRRVQEAIAAKQHASSQAASPGRSQWILRPPLQRSICGAATNDATPIYSKCFSTSAEII
jgi:hypothetical protein